MSNLLEIVAYCDKRLNSAKIDDFSGAHNGLQLQNNGEVKHVVCAVDASLAVIREAVTVGADLLIVHHGMFWHGVKPLTKSYYEKIKIAMDNNLAIYSSHLPLDMHPELGNNVLLAQHIGLSEIDFLKNPKGHRYATTGGFHGSFSELLSVVKDKVNIDLHYCNGGQEEAGMIAVMTGAAGTEIEKLKALGIDTLITGEGPHWSYVLAEEIEMNVIYAGHYATEIYGVKKLASELNNSFDLEGAYFIDKPTGI